MAVASSAGGGGGGTFALDADVVGGANLLAIALALAFWEALPLLRQKALQPSRDLAERPPIHFQNGSIRSSVRETICQFW